MAALVHVLSLQRPESWLCHNTDESTFNEQILLWLTLRTLNVGPFAPVAPPPGTFSVCDNLLSQQLSRAPAGKWQVYPKGTDSCRVNDPHMTSWYTLLMPEAYFMASIQGGLK